MKIFTLPLLKFFILPLAVVTLTIITLNIKIHGWNVGDTVLIGGSGLKSMTVKGNYFCNNCPVMAEFTFQKKQKVYKEIDCRCGQDPPCYGWGIEHLQADFEFTLYRYSQPVGRKTISKTNSSDGQRHRLDLRQVFYNNINNILSGKYKLEVKYIPVNNNPDNIREDEFNIVKTGETIKLIFTAKPEHNIQVLPQEIKVTSDVNEDLCKNTSCIAPAGKCIAITKAKYVIKPIGFTKTRSNLKYTDLSRDFNDGDEFSFTIGDLSNTNNDPDKKFKSNVKDGWSSMAGPQEFIADQTYTWEYSLTVKCIQD